jgi:hypothetical protein
MKPGMTVVLISVLLLMMMMMMMMMIIDNKYDHEFAISIRSCYGASDP